MRTFIAAIVTALTTQVATAQFNIQPHWFGPQAQYPTIGYLPNGIRVINPWIGNPYNYSGTPYGWNSNYAAYNNSVIWNPSLNPYVGLNDALYTSQSMLNNAAVWGRPVQVEPGRFVPVSPGVGVNPYTGTVLNNTRGVAYTNAGTFYRVPNTGSMTAYGRYLPGSGVYINPFSGTMYNPATGLIVR